MAGRKRKVNNVAKTRNVNAGTDEDLDDDLDEGMDDDPDAAIEDDDMAGEEGDTLELPALSEISGSATTASARRRVEDYLEMRRAARELHELEDFEFD
jgi:hypothetical protein